MVVPKGNRWMWLRHKLFVLSPRQLAWTHVVLQTLDWATTLFLISSIHTGVESNPIVRFMLESPGGAWIFTAVKAIACVGIALVLPWSLKKTGCWMHLLWRLLALAYVIVVLNNLVGVVYVCTIL